MAQSVGYAFAAVGAGIAGLLLTLPEGAQLVLAFIAAVLVLAIGFGLAASRPGFVTSRPGGATPHPSSNGTT